MENEKVNNVKSHEELLEKLEINCSLNYNSDRSGVYFIFVDLFYKLFNEINFYSRQSKRDFLKFAEENYLNYSYNENDYNLLKNDCDNDLFKDRIITWYSEENFLYKMINKILHSDDFYSLFKLRYPIHLINQKLNEINDKEISNEHYRRSIMRKEEFTIYKNNLDKFISDFEKNNDYKSIILDNEESLVKLNHLKEYGLMNENFYLLNIIQNLENSDLNLKILTEIQNDEDNKVDVKILNAMFTYVYKAKGEYTKSLEYFEKNPYLDIVENGKYESYIPDIFGLNSDLERNNENELKYYLDALTILSNKKIENHPYAASIYKSIASIYIELEDFHNAKINLLKSLDINLVLKGEKNIDLAELYHKTAEIFEFKIKNCDEALKYYIKSYEIKSKFGDDYDTQISILNSIALLYIEIYDDDENALSFLKMALRLKLKKSANKEDFELFKIYYNLSSVFCNLEKYKYALENAYEAIKLNTFNTIDQNNLDVYLLLGKIYFRMEEYEEALQNYKISLDNRKKTLGENDMRNIEIYTIMEFIYREIDNEKMAICCQESADIIIKLNRN